MTNPKPFVTRTSLVTGGGRGIGRATALALADAGSDVIVTYVANEAATAEVVAEVQKRGRRAGALHLDVAATKTFDAFVERVQSVLRSWERTKLDHLVNNAGIGGYGPFATTTEEAFDSLFDVHVKGPFFLTQKLLPLLADGGRIVNVSSGLSRYVHPGLSVYSAAKGAIDVLTRTLAVELAERGITVNVVAPGGVTTDFGGGVMRDAKLQAEVSAETPLGRVGEPEDIAGVIASLVADGTRWVTGQRIEVTGGYRL